MTNLQDFAIKMFKQAASSKEDNLVCSPFGVAALCRIIADGANKQANNELDNILGISSKELSNIIKDINLTVDKAENEDSGYEKEAMQIAYNLK